MTFFCLSHRGRFSLFGVRDEYVTVFIWPELDEDQFTPRLKRRGVGDTAETCPRCDGDAIATHSVGVRDALAVMVGGDLSPNERDCWVSIARAVPLQAWQPMLAAYTWGAALGSTKREKFLSYGDAAAPAMDRMPR